MDEPRGHHYVPQFYLRAFANSRGQLLVQGRDGSRRYRATVKSAAKRRDFYAMEGADGPSFELEKTLSKMEAKCAPTLKRMISGHLPSNHEERENFARFVALQFVRGPDSRMVAEKLMAWTGKFILKNMTPAMATDYIRKKENREPLPGEIEELLEFAHGERAFEDNFVPHQNYTISMTLQALESCARIALARTIRLLRWSTATLLTSDTPVALYSQRPSDIFAGLGFGTADQVVITLSRDTAAVLYGPWQNQPETVWHNPPHWAANMVNFLVAENAMEAIFLHPDDEHILPGLKLPPVRERGVISPAEPFHVVPRRT